MIRINKCIELLQQGQDIFTAGAPELTYEAGREMAQTWADMILTDFEHRPFDVVGLMNFMRGLKDGGPTPSGHPTPTVVTTLPSNCISPEEVYYNAWQVRQVLTTGVHGILHTHARSADAVRAFVATVRYVHQTIGRDQGIPEGRRGQGGQAVPAEIWGDISPSEYMRIADPWPLNPDGELMLGLKIEDRHCLPDADAIAGTPGLAFAEWGETWACPSATPTCTIRPTRRRWTRPETSSSRPATRLAWRSCAAGRTRRCRTRSATKYVIEEIGAKIIGVPRREIADAHRAAAGRTMPV